MKALFKYEKNWQKINVQRFSANFLFSKNGKCRSITYSGDFATLPLLFFTCVAGIFDCPCEVKCTDEVIDDGDFPRSGFLVNMGNFDPVNESAENSRVKLPQIRVLLYGRDKNLTWTGSRPPYTSSALSHSRFVSWDCRMAMTKLKVESVSLIMRNSAVFLSPIVSSSILSYTIRSRSSLMSKGASLAPQEINILLAVFPVTKCQ